MSADLAVATEETHGFLELYSAGPIDVPPHERWVETQCGYWTSYSRISDKPSCQVCKAVSRGDMERP